MSGINRVTGAWMPTDFAHVQQSIGVLLTTPKMKRVMRRYLGSDLPRLVDAPMSPNTLIDFYAAIADSITNYEPRFRVSRMSVTNATAGGQLTIAAEGVYYPRGHLGDFSVSQPATVTVPL